MIRLVNLLHEVLIAEGGNVFKGTEYDTDDASLENIEPTLKKFIVDLGKLFPNKKSTFSNLPNPDSWLGSTGQKAKSGDIDLAYSVDNFFDNGKADIIGWGMDPDKFETLYNTVKKRARTATDEQVQVTALLRLIVEKINSSNSEMYASDKATSSGTLHFSYPEYAPSGEKLPNRVQLDLDTGNIDWLKFRYNSDVVDDPEANVKGLHRGQLMLALFSAKGYTYKAAQGFINKDTREVDASTPQEAIDLLNNLYGFNIDKSILGNYKTLSSYIKQNLSNDDYDEVMKIYLTTLDRTGPQADIPWDLQDYWIKNQDRLNLKGKFLPDNSKLAKYKK